MFTVYNLFLVVERTTVIGLVWIVLAIYNVMHVINRGVLVAVLRDQTISKCLYNLFLAVK